MKKAYKVSEIGKIKPKEIIIFIILFLLGPFVIWLFNGVFRFIVFLIILGVILHLIFLWKRERKTRGYPKNYSLLLLLLFFSFSDIFIITFIKLPVAINYGIIVAFFAYLYITGILVYYFLNFVFMVFVKMLFPYERNEGNEEKRRQIDLLSHNKLSKYIDLHKQKLYSSLTLINFFVYCTFVIFLMLYLTKIIKIERQSEIYKFYLWVKELEEVTLFNGVALLSLMITIYTITFPIQKKILEDARKKLLEKYKEYL